MDIENAQNVRIKKLMPIAHQISRENAIFKKSRN